MNKNVLFLGLVFLLGTLFINQSQVRGENFLYTFGVSSDTVDLDNFARISIVTDANIDKDYTYVTHQVTLSDAPPKITFESNLPKNLISSINLSYRDVNSSWKNVIVNLDSNATNARFSLDTEGKKGVSDYQFNLIYVINSRYVFNLEPNILHSFDFIISNHLGPDDIATLTIKIPAQFKPFNSLGWRLQGDRFFYSTTLSDQSNVNAIFYLEEYYGDSIQSLKNEVIKLTQENAKLTQKIIEMQTSIESYRIKNEELTANVKDLKDELKQANEQRKQSESATTNFRYLSWGLTLSLPGMQFLLNELREKNKISPTQLHLGTVIGTFVVFIVLYLALFI